MSPADLVCRARDKGVGMLALTDHDTTAGLREAQQAAQSLDLTLVPGVEVSVSWAQKVVHIIGLGVDAGHAGLQQGLSRLRERRQERSVRLAERLERIGVPDSLAGARRLAGRAAPGRVHFARYLVACGYARDMRRAFTRYLGHGGSCYVPCQWAGLDEAVAWITAAGGEAVVAHPLRYGMGRGMMRRFLREFAAAGGVGIEVISGGHNPEHVRAAAAFAREFDLYASVGSDFHEPGQGGTELGRLAELPSGCTPIWERWASSAPGDDRAGAASCST